MKLLLFSLIILFSSTTSCDANKKLTTNHNNTMTNKPPESYDGPISIKYYTGPCRGNCPVMELNIQEDGSTTFKGDKNSPKSGIYSSKLSNGQLEELRSLIKKADWWNLNENYDSGIVDAPTTSIIVKIDEQLKKISLRAQIPESIKPVQNHLQGIILNTDWNAIEIFQNDDIYYEYSTGPCFGECPIFNLKIDNFGRAIYTGKKNTQLSGINYRQLSNSEMDALNKAATEANILKLNNEYISQIVDIPTKTFIYRQGDMAKKIIIRGKAPESLQNVIQIITSYTQNGNWVAEKRHNDLPLNTIANEIIIKLNNQSYIDNIIQNYQQYDIKLKKKISVSQKMYLVHFDTKKIEPQKMIEILSADKMIQTASFNKEVNIRTR